MTRTGLSFPRLELTIDALSKESSAEACNLLTDIYLNVEPTTSVLDVSREDFTRFATSSFEYSVADGLATGVKHHDELVGVLLCKDYHAHQTRGIRLAPSFGPIQKLMDTHRPYTPKYSQEKVLYCSNLAVKSMYLGKGIGKVLLYNVLGYAKRNGYTRAVAECNSIQSQKILERAYAPTLLNYIDYRSFEYRGERVFGSIGKHGGSKLYEIDLSAAPDRSRGPAWTIS